MRKIHEGWSHLGAVALPFSMRQIESHPLNIRAKTAEVADLESRSDLVAVTRVTRGLGTFSNGGAAVMPMPDFLTSAEETRLDRRTQRIYQRAVQILPWASIAECTRAVFRDRPRPEIWQQGKLLSGPSDHIDDGAYSQLVELDYEVDEVIHSVN